MANTGFMWGWLQKGVSPFVNFSLFGDVYLKADANGGGFLWSEILRRTPFCNFNCSLACVKHTMSGVSPGTRHCPACSGAGFMHQNRARSKDIFIGIFYIVQIRKFQFLMILLGTGSRFHLHLAQLRCWRKLPWWETDPFPSKPWFLGRQ